MMDREAWGCSFGQGSPRQGNLRDVLTTPEQVRGASTLSSDHQERTVQPHPGVFSLSLARSYLPPPPKIGLEPRYNQCLCLHSVFNCETNLD